MKEYTRSELAMIDIMAKLERLGRNVAARIADSDESEKKFWNTAPRKQNSGESAVLASLRASGFHK